MKILFLALAMLVHPSASWAKACPWPEWEQFKESLISRDGRVIDPSSERHITTSEGQSYAMFFALAADDRSTFQELLRWTENNLARGDLTARLPSWLWGRKDDGTYDVLDTNSASDSDLWIAYSLLEAGRLWGMHGYGSLGTLLAQRIAREEVTDLPGFGSMLLPGKIGFVDDNLWRVNPSYMPLQVLARLRDTGQMWEDVRLNTVRLLVDTAPKGYAPDWAAWHKEDGWLPDPRHGSAGDYDAIRVYLWIGMLAADSDEKAELLEHFSPMAELTARNKFPPATVNAISGKHEGEGPAGFSAALLPFLADTPAAQTQRELLKQEPPGTDAYYGQVLALFGQGWDQQRFRFNKEGELIPAWNACAN